MWKVLTDVTYFAGKLCGIFGRAASPPHMWEGAKGEVAAFSIIAKTIFELVDWVAGTSAFVPSTFVVKSYCKELPWWGMACIL